MTDTGRLLQSLEVITHEAREVQAIIAGASPRLPEHERRGALERAATIRAAAQELLDWASAVRLDVPRS